jgi:hypothetical protein
MVCLDCKLLNSHQKRNASPFQQRRRGLCRQVAENVNGSPRTVLGEPLFVCPREPLQFPQDTSARPQDWLCRYICGGGRGAGIALWTGLIDFKYANIALRSSSVICPMVCQGIGGRMSRDIPMNLPVRSVLMNISSGQPPMPVCISGVRLYAKLTPHGPAHAVRSMFVSAPHFPGPSVPAGISGSGEPAVYPARSRVVSGTGPWGVMTFGVWQSLQPPTMTRYFPRSTGDCCGPLGAQPASTSPAAAVLKSVLAVRIAALRMTSPLNVNVSSAWKRNFFRAVEREYPVRIQWMEIGLCAKTRTA